MNKLTYKGNKYALIQLIKYYYDEGLRDFKDGEVQDESTGEVFDIRELFYIYKEKLYDLLQNSRNFSTTQEQLQIKRIYEKQIKDIRIIDLRSKLEDDTITLVEIEEWISLMSHKDRTNFGVAKYSNFIQINHAKPKPKGLSRSDYSRFFELIYIMNYENSLKYSNGKPIKREKLCELLEFVSVSGLDKFISKLKKYNMVIRTEPNINRISFLMVNPAYAMRQMQIDLTTYNYFKEDLDELLTPLEKKYIELKGNSLNSNSILQVES